MNKSIQILNEKLISENIKVRIENDELFSKEPPEMDIIFDAYYSNIITKNLNTYELEYFIIKAEGVAKGNQCVKPWEVIKINSVKGEPYIISIKCVEALAYFFILSLLNYI